MKKQLRNTIRHGKPRSALVVVSIVIVAAVAVSVMVGYNRLRDIWLEQCVIRDPAKQVSVTSGRMVKPDVIAENLGLVKGGNLACIDFDAKRTELLRRVPNLREISVTRHLPDRVSVVAEERSPIARMNIRGQRTETGRVVDSEGMVFVCQRGTQTLPVIREQLSPGTAVGTFLKDRSRAALNLIEACHEPEFSELSILEVDISKPDFLVATLANYSRAKIAWEGMDETTPASRASLNRQISMLIKAMRTQVAAGAVIWNVTDTGSPGRVYANTQEKL